MSYEGASANLVTIPVVGGVVAVDTNGYTRVGSFFLDMTSFIGLEPAADLAVILETTDVANNADVRVYNVTTSSVLGADPLLTTTSLTPVRLSTVIVPTAGGNLYELQMRMRVGLAPDQVTCSNAFVLISWSDY